MADKIESMSSVGFHTLQPSGSAFAKVVKDGRVLIDWPEVQRAAADSFEPTTQAIARVMLAVRDGKWEPLPRDE